MADSIIDGLLTAGVVILALLFVILVLRWSPLRHSLARREVQRHFTAPMRFFELTKPLPPRLSAVGDDLEAHGATFVAAREVLVGHRPMPIAQVLYLADEGTILVEVVCGFDPSNPDPAASCLSLVGSRRGLLVTEGLRNAPELDAELLQVFSGAPATQLLAEHRRALALVRDRGIEVATIDEQDATDALDEWSSLTRAAWTEHGSVYADRFLANQESGAHEQAGSIARRPDLDAQLRALE